jgi:hypothetical protein
MAFSCICECFYTRNKPWLLPATHYKWAYLNYSQPQKRLIEEIVGPGLISKHHFYSLSKKIALNLKQSDEYLSLSTLSIVDHGSHLNRALVMRARGLENSAIVRQGL